MEQTGCKIICGAPVTLAVKGLMMMMMILSKIFHKFVHCVLLFLEWVMPGSGLGTGRTSQAINSERRSFKENLV